MPDLAIIVPTRGRPDNVRKVISAWDFTNAWDHADLVLVADADDPEIGRYHQVVEDVCNPDTGVTPMQLIEIPAWLPMVHKLNAASRHLADLYWAVGFAGDDHLPQTIGWAARYLTVLRELGTGMVYGDDGYQGRKLSTEWAVTSDVVRALGRMVPAPVEHMYCDNAMMDLFGAAGALRHLPEVRIEHMHPVAGKAKTDAQYDRVNHRDQFAKDRRAYEGWKRAGMESDVATIRLMRAGMPDEAAPQPLSRRLSQGSGPRRVDLRPKGKIVGRNFPFPRHFKNVRGATPDDIGITLADFARMVPADQEIVELGVFQGRTALMMAWGARQGEGAHLTGVDAWALEGNTYGPPFNEEGSRSHARYNVQALGYSSGITLINDFAVNAAKGWGVKPVGLLFVDDDHSYEGARSAIEAWAPHLADGARIAVDDYGHPDWPGVAQAVDALVDEGFLAPVEIFHDRLAVTSLADVIQRTDPAPVVTARAITSEGVSPSPYPAVGDQVAVTVDLGAPSVIVPDGEDWPGNIVPEVDREMSTEPVQPKMAPIDEVEGVSRGDAWRLIVQHGELIGVAEKTRIETLNLVNLKALARARGIVLGVRKDKREAILQALRDGL